MNPLQLPQITGPSGNIHSLIPIDSSSHQLSQHQQGVRKPIILASSTQFTPRSRNDEYRFTNSRSFRRDRSRSSERKYDDSISQDRKERHFPPRSNDCSTDEFVKGRLRYGHSYDSLQSAADQIDNTLSQILVPLVMNYPVHLSMPV